MNDRTLRSLVPPVCLVAALAASVTPAHAQCFVAYQDANYGGAATEFCAGGTPMANDSYSSFRIPRGMRVRVFEHSDQSGIARTYFGDVPFVGHLYNDRISSLSWGGFASDGFTMLVASDPQFSWNHCSDSSSSSECARERSVFAGKGDEELGRMYNGNLVRALNDVGDHIGAGALAGVIVNGDLTEFGDQGPDLGDYISMYEHGLDMNVYLGLGNHDYANNVDDCANNGCASQMIWYAARQVPTLNPRAFDYAESGVYYQFPTNRKRHEGSLGYSWEIGDVHFVQLHNYPSYTRSWSGWNFSAARRDHFEIRGAMAWLRSDLERARSAGKDIVLNLHDWGAVRDDAELHAILDEFPVSAVFAGHWHGTWGEWEQRGPFADGRRVPVLLSGSAHHGTFLVTRYLGGRLYVWTFMVDHFDGAKLKVRSGGVFREVGDLGNVLRVCQGCARFYDYAYDLR
jgi:cytolysin (calcineurin-like family phosphatase)